MEEDNFKKTEGKLYRYYKNLKLIAKMKRNVSEYQDKIEEVKRDIKNFKDIENFTNLNMGIDYSRDKIQVSVDPANAVENTVIRHMQEFEKEIKEYERIIFSTNKEIRRIEIEQHDMEYKISNLSEEGKRFLEWKYGENKSIGWIAIEMYGGAKTTAARRRIELVNQVSLWCDLNIK